MGVPVKAMKEALGRASRMWRTRSEDRLLVDLEVVLAAVGLVGDDDDVARGLTAAGVRWTPRREELLDGGEDHAAGGPFQQVAQAGSVRCLHRSLTQQGLGSGRRWRTSWPSRSLRSVRTTNGRVGHGGVQRSPGPA
jgi:hypothetical protein